MEIQGIFENTTDLSQKLRPFVNLINENVCLKFSEKDFLVWTAQIFQKYSKIN